MSFSLREIANEQFQDGTTIDGNRLSRLVRQVANFWNNIPLRNVRRRWMPNTVCGGFTPQQRSDGAQDSLPWLGAYNSDKQLVGSSPDDGYQNKWRSKGNVVSGINPANPDPNSKDDLLTWSTTLYFRKPARIVGVLVNYITDSAYGNDWQFGSSQMPPGKSANSYVDDWTISIEVDDPYDRENRKLTSIAYHRLQSAESAWWFSNKTASPGHDMQPPHPGGHLGQASSKVSLWVDDDNVDIPVPRDSRVRLCLTIPKYEIVGARPDDYNVGWNANGTIEECWQMQTYNWALTFLESIDE